MIGFQDTGEAYLLSFGCIGIAAAMASSIGTWVHCPELFDTRARSSIHAVANAAGRLGGVLCTYWTEADFSTVWVGFGLMVISFVCAGFVLTLPDTREAKLK